MARTLVITGAAGGIGRALVPLLEGDRLLLIDRAASGIADLAGESGAVHVAGSPLSAAECAEALGAVDGPIDGFVHLAGTFEPDPALGETPEIWTRTIQNNLENAYNFVTALIPRLPEGGMGRIVLISSLAFRRGGPSHTAYSAAKGGLVGMTRSLARRLGERATVNALAPGIIETPMPADLIRERGSALLAENPLGRFGQPHEVATVIRFLLSEDASYINGQTINVDGGVSMP
ncbi:MAG: SDR family oxidoreductase [Paracoccaceae bacterium]|nr:SDR family oxidoreductase [Paracoccaceae bacterium]